MTVAAVTTQPDLAFSFLQTDHRPSKPRTRGVTEIRGPYYTVMGSGYLSDLLDAMGDHVDSLRFSGGSLMRLPEDSLRSIVRTAHRHAVLVCAGGVVEPVLAGGADAFERYVDACARRGVDIVEISAGFAPIRPDDLLRLFERAHKAGMRARLAFRCQADGVVAPEELEPAGIRRVIEIARRALDAGASMTMIESEANTEGIGGRRSDVVTEIVSAFGSDKVMFEAADAEVFGWCVKTYGPDVNLVVDHSQIVHLACLRARTWGIETLRGRARTRRPEHDRAKGGIERV